MKSEIRAATETDSARLMQWAGAVTWVVIAIDQLQVVGHSTAGYASVGHLVGLSALGGFLTAFLAAGHFCVAGSRARLGATLLTAQALLALLNIALVGSFAAPVMLVIVAAQVPERLSPRWGWIFLVAANLAFWAVLAWIRAAPSSAISVFLYAGFQVFAVFAAQSTRRAEQARAELARVNAHLLATRSLLEDSARDAERLRLSRELHDVAGHKLTALKLNLELALRGAPEQQANQVEKSRRLAEELLEDIRAVVSQLRQYDGLDLAVLLTELVERMPGPQIHLSIEPTLRIPRVDQAEAVLRCVQEALTNAARHAHARNVWVGVRREAGEVVVEIRDDGRGSAALVAGNGLTGMRERIEELGGAVRFDTRGGAGFALSARLPMLEAAA